MASRSIFRLRLRTFLLLIAVISLVLGGHLERQRRERRRLLMCEAICAAAIAGDAGRIRRLLDEGAEVETVVDGRSASTLLMETAAEGHLEASRVLIERGANVNRQERDGFPPVNIAAYRGQWDVVRLLVEHGADTTIVDATGKDPAGHARAHKAEEMARYLTEHARSAH